MSVEEDVAELLEQGRRTHTTLTTLATGLLELNATMARLVDTLERSALRAPSAPTYTAPPDLVELAITRSLAPTMARARRSDGMLILNAIALILGALAHFLGR